MSNFSISVNGSPVTTYKLEELGVKDTFIYNVAHTAETRKQVIRYLAVKSLPPKELAHFLIREESFF